MKSSLNCEISIKFIGRSNLKKITIILIALIATVMFIVTGCSSEKEEGVVKEVIEHDYTYKGENEFWVAEYKVDGTWTFIEKDNFTDFSSESSRRFKITYKKDLSDLTSVKHLVISYSVSGGGGGDMELEGDSITETTFTSESRGRGGAIPNKDAVVTVTIDADGEIQTFELKSVD